MTTTTRTLTALALGATALLSTGCSSGNHTDQTSFDFHGTALVVTNSNANMPVTVHGGDAGKVSVSVTTTAVGKDANTPVWALSGNALDLGSPCTNGYVGVCEGSYTITVPTGTKVTVNGKDTPSS